MRKASLGITAFVAGMLLMSPSVRAAEDPCVFAPKFERLKAIQADGSQNYIEAIKAQLEVRKSILRGVIDCAMKDVKERQKQVDALPADFNNGKTKEEIARGLKESEEYYIAQRRTIEDLGIKGTQDLAREIAVWRDSTYHPLVSREDDLLLWDQNQSVFETVQSRFNQIRPVVLSLKILSAEQVQSGFKEAESSFEEAAKKNEAAKEAIAKGESASGLIKSSLEPLSGIYKKFLELSDQVKKIVP